MSVIGSAPIISDGNVRCDTISLYEPLLPDEALSGLPDSNQRLFDVCLPLQSNALPPELNPVLFCDTISQVSVIGSAPIISD